MKIIIYDTHRRENHGVEGIKGKQPKNLQVLSTPALARAQFSKMAGDHPGAEFAGATCILKLEALHLLSRIIYRFGKLIAQG